MNRRTLLTTAAAGAAVGLAGVASAAPGSPAELNALFDAFVSEEIGIGDIEAAFEHMHRGEVLRSVVIF